MDSDDEDLTIPRNKADKSLSGIASKPRKVCEAIRNKRKAKISSSSEWSPCETVSERRPRSKRIHSKRLGHKHRTRKSAAKITRSSSELSDSESNFCC